MTDTRAVLTAEERAALERLKHRRQLLTAVQAEAWEAELRDVERCENTERMRLFMQAQMQCGHVVGDLLTCPDPPIGCASCLAEESRRADEDALIATVERLAQENDSLRTIQRQNAEVAAMWAGRAVKAEAEAREQADLRGLARELAQALKEAQDEINSFLVVAAVLITPSQRRILSDPQHEARQALLARPEVQALLP